MEAYIEAEKTNGSDIRRLRYLIQCKATSLSLARGLGCSGITKLAALSHLTEVI